MKLPFKIQPSKQAFRASFFINIIALISYFIVIGSFSILVGGFGIANIMFVSVKERVPIIGLQKSLGAKKYFILTQQGMIRQIKSKN